MACDPGRDVTYVVATLKHAAAALKDNSSFLAGYLRELPNLHVAHAVNGYNHSETLEELLVSGVQFHNLSSGGRSWGRRARSKMGLAAAV